MKCCRLISIFLVLGLCLILASSASAMKITNLTTGDILFSDNFEDGTVGELPVAQIGSYGGSGDNMSSSRCWVLDTAKEATDPTVPGPYSESSKYLQVERIDTAYQTARMDMDPTKTISVGDEIHLEYMLSVDASDVSGATAYFVIPALTWGTSTLTGVYVNADSQVLTRTSSSTTSLNTTLDPLEWYKFEIDYVLGASTFSFATDGVTLSGTSELPVFGSSYDFTDGSGLRARFATSSMQNAPLFLDATPAVPEPGTLGLMLVGLAALGVSRLCRR